MAERMTFNHGVRSSTLRWVTTLFAALAQLDRVFGYEPKGRGFESLTPCQQKENFCLPKVLFLFIQAAGDKPSAWHIIAARSAAHIIKGGSPPLYLITL